MLIEGFPEGGSYRDCPSEGAGVESGKIFTGCGPRIGGVEERGPDREFRFDVHGCFVEVSTWL